MLRFLFNFIFAISFICFSGMTSLYAGETTKTFDSQEIVLDTYPSPIGGYEKLMKEVVYPEAAKKKGESGKVLLKLTFDAQGKILKVDVAESLGSEFDKSAIDAVKKVQWKPATAKGQQVECEIMLPVSFKLEPKK